ncbi:MAG: MmgE/PrpD family protein [Pseudomonadota bacterium]
MTSPLTYFSSFRLSDAPDRVRHQASRCLLDLVGVAVGASGMRMPGIVRDHAAAVMPGPAPLVFDGRGVSPLGQALALGMTIDALDGHDGCNPTKGHVGCGLLAGLIALWPEVPRPTPDAFLEAVILGYEAGTRLGTTLHATAPDYHTSGAWIAPTVALVGSRLLGLDPTATAHAVGIAEYHGPRSQMMRVIDHPTMLKDGSGWGAMAGVSAVLLARAGITGAPALTLEGPEWQDLGHRWCILDQYFKPYPVCRWAQPPVEAALALRRSHSLRSTDITAIQIESFHEATRPATSEPRTSDEAQYSTSFPTAIALVRGHLHPGDLADDALDDPEVLRLSRITSFVEDDAANEAFPGRRIARVTLTLSDGKRLQSDWKATRWDAEEPPTDDELEAKFRDLVFPVLGPRMVDLKSAIDTLSVEGPAPLIAVLAHANQTPVAVGRSA